MTLENYLARLARLNKISGDFCDFLKEVKEISDKNKEQGIGEPCPDLLNDIKRVSAKLSKKNQELIDEYPKHFNEKCDI